MLILHVENILKKKIMVNILSIQLGHGIGLEVHEFPTISYRSNTKLKENMAITVEPGVYLANKFGIRIEDSLIVKDRPIIMHKFTKDLLRI